MLEKFHGCFEEVFRVFQESLKGVSRKIERYFNGVSSQFEDVGGKF